MLNKVIIEGYAMNVVNNVEDSYTSFWLHFEQVGKLVKVRVSSFAKFVPEEGAKVRVTGEIHSTVFPDEVSISVIVHSIGGNVEEVCDD